MKKELNRKNSEISIQFLLWILLLGTILYIFYCYYSGLLSRNEQLVISISITILLLFLLVKYANLSFSLAILFGTGYALIYLFWGSTVPYIQFFPFIVTYLLNISRNEKYINLVLIVSLLFTAFELLGILPLFKIEQIEVGIPNLIIILSVQSITYLIWRSILNLYAILDKVNFLGISDLIPNTSNNFLISTLAKGLYISILFHFFNNFLNSIIWGAKIPDARLKVLKLFSESDRNCTNISYTLRDIISLIENNLNAQKTAPQLLDLNFTIGDAKILFLLLYNINHNYQKRKSIINIRIQSVPRAALKISFIPTHKVVYDEKQVWSRNLGTMKQLLQLTGKGTIEIITKPVFTTRLTFSVCNSSNDSISDL